ncbi:hypothetical protein QVD17_14974 [Tagetes erecta]|uniref:Uncharacterized protein n=1 Tax=Tagetes erecta TaxID=13708 RepID=A0AAD8NYA9_TARER|nr:hypothetical protein QVD17_14974 [Tagetes erecta]
MNRNPIDRHVPDRCLPSYLAPPLRSLVTTDICLFDSYKKKRQFTIGPCAAYNLLLLAFNILQAKLKFYVSIGAKVSLSLVRKMLLDMEIVR